MLSRELQLQAAQAELTRVQTEQSAKVASAQQAFEADPTEAMASQLNGAERIADLMIGKATKALETIEAEIEQARVDALRIELHEIRSQTDSFPLKQLVQERAKKQAALRRQLFDDSMALDAEYVRLYQQRLRAEEIATQLGESLGMSTSEALKSLDAAVSRVADEILLRGIAEDGFNRNNGNVWQALQGARHP